MCNDAVGNAFSEQSSDKTFGNPCSLGTIADKTFRGNVPLFRRIFVDQSSYVYLRSLRALMLQNLGCYTK